MMNPHKPIVAILVAAVKATEEPRLGKASRKAKTTESQTEGRKLN